MAQALKLRGLKGGPQWTCAGQIPLPPSWPQAQETELAGLIQPPMVSVRIVLVWLYPIGEGGGLPGEKSAPAPSFHCITEGGSEAGRALGLLTLFHQKGSWGVFLA